MENLKGMGVMMDDALAGLYSNLILQLSCSKSYCNMVSLRKLRLPQYSPQALISGNAAAGQVADNCSPCQKVHMVLSSALAIFRGYFNF